jgi:hypothetical protein
LFPSHFSVILVCGTVLSRTNIRTNRQTHRSIGDIRPFTSTLMMETGETSEMLIFISTLTRLIARENFSAVFLRENFKSYTFILYWLSIQDCLNGKGKAIAETGREGP